MTDIGKLIEEVEETAVSLSQAIEQGDHFERDMFREQLADAAPILAAKVKRLQARITELEAPGECQSIHKLRAEVEELRLTLARASAFEVAPPTPDNPLPIRVERMMQLDSSILWAVRRAGNVLSTAGRWEYEPMPSSRTKAFLKRCRFATFEAAMLAADKAPAKP